MRVLDLFSGIGGFSLGLERAGMETVAFCEIDPYCQKVLNKHWPDVPIYEDVTGLTGEKLESDGITGIDVICGGFPCQDVSVAGDRKGLDGERSGLWSEFARLIGDIRPAYAIVENVTGLLSGDNGRWFGAVLGDLAQIGYDAEWHCIPASAVGAPHRRDRVWVLAHPECEGRERPFLNDSIFSGTGEAHPFPMHRDIETWDEVVGRSCPVRGGNGVSVGMDRNRVRGLGNAVVPQIPEIIGRAIMQCKHSS